MAVSGIFRRLTDWGFFACTMLWMGGWSCLTQPMVCGQCCHEWPDWMQRRVAGGLDMSLSQELSCWWDNAAGDYKVVLLYASVEC